MFIYIQDMKKWHSYIKTMALFIK